MVRVVLFSYLTIKILLSILSWASVSVLMLNILIQAVSCQDTFARCDFRWFCELVSFKNFELWHITPCVFKHFILLGSLSVNFDMTLSTRSISWLSIQIYTISMLIRS